MIDFAALRAPVPAEDVEWRLQTSGEKNGRVWALCVPYLTNRAIQARLDEVVGPANWRNEFTRGPDGGVLCGLSIRVEGCDASTGEVRHEWVTKWDGAENTDVEGVKGGLSGAMKRAAVQWGIGRYLYDVGDDLFAKVHDDGRFRGKTKEGKPFRWDPPSLPASALPTNPSPRPAVTPRPAPTSGHAPAPVPTASAAPGDRVFPLGAEYKGVPLRDLPHSEMARAIRYCEERAENDAGLAALLDDLRAVALAAGVVV